MKPAAHISRRSSRAFTLPEMMIAITIFLIVIVGILSAHIFGLRMMQMNSNKLKTTEWSRKTFGRMADEVRSSYAAAVGNLDTTNSSFEGLLDGEPQQGTALLITPTTDTNSYILYFLNTVGQTFTRMTDQPGSAVTLAYSITNVIAFTAQDFSGNVLSNQATSNNPVIHMLLQFSEPESFLQESHQYKLETSMTRR
ncbi:MAG TPA: prepilin-type N-terminal cleavage/methylation domain-containing protein [Verrucomicrobiae bacterium]|nr:prepilin-type N-terminal cleavage/methylation domain-containing protein [Verrucomicrobiae bacterium]